MAVGANLQSIPLFAHLREEDVNRISRFARDRSYPKNSVIVFEEDPGDSLYVVMSGQVKVVLIGEDGREVILSTPSKGDFFGEMSLIDDQPRSAHVIAMEDSQLLVLRREDFHQCLSEMPGIAIGLLRAMCKRLRQADNKIGGLVLLDVPGRVARLLLELADENDGEHITKRITHHLIAQMIGSSRETVSRTMRSLVDRGLIEVSRSKIKLCDREILETAAGRDTMGPAQRFHYDGKHDRRRHGNARHR
ncbi:MAG: Crp/Fnr family transcriptional regulator [Gemmatimonadetes bacterium]|nr:Crp/Fnr family transcriptional regulator [Gemmatimonadota bacterium]